MRGYESSDGGGSSCDDHDEEESLFDECDQASFGNASTRSLNVVQKDIQLMNVIRGIVILVILTMTVISADCVFVVTTEHEEHNFKVAFVDVTAQLNRHFYSRVENALWMAKSVAVGIAESTQSQSNDIDGQNTAAASWPNVTISNFAALVESPLYLTNASVVTFAPLVTTDSRNAWEAYATIQHQHVNVHHASVQLLPNQRRVDVDNVTYYHSKRKVEQGVYSFENGVALDLNVSESSDTDSYSLFPIWQVYPPADNKTLASSHHVMGGTLFDEASHPSRHAGLVQMLNRQGSSISSFLYQDTNSSDLAQYQVPRSILYYPIVESNTNADAESLAVSNATSGVVVGSIGLQFQWEAMLQNAITDHKEAVIVIIDNAFGESFSYQVNGVDASFLGAGDHHDTLIDGYTFVVTDYAKFAALFDMHGALPLDPHSSCRYKIRVYPSPEFKTKFLTNRPDIFRGIVLLALFIVVGIFIAFDAYLDRHQNKVLNAAKQSDAIVRSLFPTAVTDRLYEEARKTEADKANEWKGSHFETPKSRVKKFMRHPDGATIGSHDSEEGDQIMTDPIADLFPNTTVLFADLAGFTAWSSEREPAQVFVLLETIYRAMDKAAKRMNIFKVETIGDCYVAATGLPEPQEDHAERMCKFARKALRSVAVLTKRLEARLGPGTADLQMRIGIHSGPVTAGVLRGQKARFQLFGDTMNTASRIESSGAKNRIHLSKETARLLPQTMVIKREDVVTLKGKGPQETFWLTLPTESSASFASSMSDDSDKKSSGSREHTDGEWEGTSLEGILGQTKVTPEMESLIDWNVDVLKPLLASIVSHRVAMGSKPAKDPRKLDSDKIDLQVQMVIPLPAFDARVVTNKPNQSNQSISMEVEAELREFVKAIATCYPRNPFHSFEHCSHVVLSATKLLKRILAPDDVKQQMEATTTMKNLHEHTFGIASDPICQFGVVFSALIHDCGHCGISNARLAIEEPMIAEKYDGRSIAEQRSLEIAFELLNQPRFKKLRACIYHNEDECVRFRHVVVNSVMATDIFDKEWTALRNARWNTAFHEKAKEKAPDSVLDMNRKATIVLEHIILASDVAHTMQHFFIYQKWNERLFQEMYNAFLVGRSDKDPSIGWYGGELWFYDNYIIPLAHKLKECGVFGVNSDEYLDYAMQNRQEWEQKGAAMVEAMVERAHKRAAKKQNQMETVMEEVVEDSSCAVVESEVLEALESLDEEEEDEEKADEKGAQAAGPRETPQQSVEVTVESMSDARPTCRTVMAPSGKLYVVLNTTSEKGLIRVDEVARESPLLGLLHAGEYIVSIDGTPTLNLPAYEVGVLLNKNRERRLEVVADGAIARALVNLAEKRDEDSTDKFFSM